MSLYCAFQDTTTSAYFVFNIKKRVHKKNVCSSFKIQRGFIGHILWCVALKVRFDQIYIESWSIPTAAQFSGLLKIMIKNCINVIWVVILYLNLSKWTY